MHHGERESVEIFKLKAGPVAPTLTWVGCVVYSAGASGNGVVALPGDAFAASNLMSTNDAKAADKLMAGGQKRGEKTSQRRRRFLRIMGSQPRRMANSSSWQDRGTRPRCACRSTAHQGSRGSPPSSRSP